MFGDKFGYALADRLWLAKTYGRLCRLAAEQDLMAVCTSLSLFSECHAWNRENLPRYLEVYLRLLNEVLAARDPKGLYESGATSQL